MAKRSASIQKLVDAVNGILRQPEVYTMKNGKLKVVTSASSEGRAFKDGLCECLQIALHTSNSYKGFAYLELDEDYQPVDEFRRKYF